MSKKSKSRKNRKSGGKSVVKTSGGDVSPRLQFPVGEISGLSPVSMSVAGDKNPPAIVREILQNSLDAAKAAGRKCAKILFSLEQVAVNHIPGIKEYKNALNKVGEFCEQVGWPAQSRSVFNAIKDRLAQDKLPVLFVADNGSGLDKRNMSAILSDGVNQKDKPGLGSKGNGHFTTFNLSGLRYILYGGVSRTDGKLAAGHAILASHQNAGSPPCGKDGYYVVDILPDLFNRYNFPKNDNIHPFIADKLVDVESQWETGALLAVLDFDCFGEKPSFEMTAKLILGAAARNFFVAVSRGELTVDVASGGNRLTLNTENMNEVMRDMSPCLGQTPKFPGHEKAERFYRLFTENGERESGVNQISIETEGGNFGVIYRERGVAFTTISLCRNGMWITDRIPMVESSKFTDYAPFEALILCDETNASELVCEAEDNLHNSLNRKHITDPARQRMFKNSMQKVRVELQSRLTERPSDSIDFIEMEGTGGSVEVSPGRNTPKGERVGPARGVGGGNGKGKSSGKKRKGGSSTAAKPGSRINVRCVAVRTGNKMRIRIVPQESLKTAQEAELRLVRNDGSDLSCDAPGADSTRLRLTKVVCGGKECAIDGEGMSARIGALDENDAKEISVEFTNPQSKGSYKVDCEFIRRAVRT